MKAVSNMGANANCGVCISVSKVAFILPLLLGSLMNLEASQVRRVVSGQEDQSKTYIEEKAEYELLLKVPSKIQTVMDYQGRKAAQLIQFDIENRRGVRLPTSKLKAGDLLLEPLYLIGPGRKARVEYLPEGHILEEKDLIYIRSTSFRQMYDAGGVLLSDESLKVGSTLDAYAATYDEYNTLVYDESGFQNSEGQVIIENGVTLEPHHLAMMKFFTPYPVRIREAIDVDLELYLRVDWPEERVPQARQYWVRRDGEALPLLLYSYEIKEGDRPLRDIETLEREIICAADQELSLKGAKNSLEVLDKHKDAIMLSKRRLPINSVDPVTGDPNDREVEPGQLVIAPRNEGEYMRSFVVSSSDDINQMMLDSKYSFARALGSEKADFPFEAHLTHYIVPFEIPCVSGCDARLEISDDVMKGKSHCDKCDRDVSFRPYVIGEVPAYSYQDKVWKESDINCAVCSSSFSYATAHALAGSKEDMVEYEAMARNVVHPSRLRNARLVRGTELTEDVIYYNKGKEITVPKGTLVNDELRMRLEERATSPIYIETPESKRTAGAQCPHCFAWNAKPAYAESLKGRLGLDQYRRGMATFPLVDGRVNRLDLVVFGLNDKVEPVSGRSMAKVVTFKRFGDEHFRNLQGWKKVEEKWSYLPRYRYEKGYTRPEPLHQDASSTGGSSAGEDLFGDDDF